MKNSQCITHLCSLPQILNALDLDCSVEILGLIIQRFSLVSLYHVNTLLSLFGTDFYIVIHANPNVLACFLVVEVFWIHPAELAEIGAGEKSLAYSFTSHDRPAAKNSPFQLQIFQPMHRHIFLPKNYIHSK